ncbi:acyl-CoA-binding protein homolog isoform X1 [Cydia pomonella]|uniref:acyl-CoA-binding protein homolog isoform X1 n=1 Tax=Cydia pomonella TaxID=82600 RepID=UPI002ADE29D3|nr:acyl-CoA-binding protein homolog isoform X1 [Cydia pomonella]
MADMEVQFDKAAEDVKKLKTSPADADLLEIYGWFKQATVGDADPANKPGFLDFKGKAKFEAWSKNKGKSKEEAQKAYIAKVESLIASIGLQ